VDVGRPAQLMVQIVGDSLLEPFWSVKLFHTHIPLFPLIVLVLHAAFEHDDAAPTD
jgi:hypothetical protein